MTKYLLATLLLFHLSLASGQSEEAQPSQNKVIAYLKKAKELTKARSYDSSNYYFEKYLPLLDKEESRDIYYASRIDYIRNLIFARRNNQADSLNELLFQEIEQEGSGYEVYLFRTFESKAILAYVKGEYPFAATQYKQAIAGFQSLKDTTLNENIASIYNSLGVIYSRLSIYPLASQYLQNALEIYEKSGAADQRFHSVHNNLGILFTLQGKYPRALAHYEKSLKYYDQVADSKNSPGYASTFSNLSIIYKETGKINKAIEYLQKTAQIQEENNLATKVRSYITLANYHAALEEEELARSYLLKSDPLVDHNDPELLGRLYGAWATYHASKEEPDYEKSNDYCNRAIDLFTTAEYHIGVSTTMFSIAENYFASGDYKRGEAVALKAIAPLENLGEQRAYLVDFLGKLATEAFKNRYLEKALAYADQSIEMNLGSLEISEMQLDNVHNEVVMFQALRTKARCIQQLSSNQESGVEALSIYSLSDSLMSQIHWQESSLDQVLLLDIKKDLYQDAVELAIDLFRQTNAHQFLEQAFSFSERGKNMGLNLQLSQSLEKKFGNIPNSILTQESYLKEDISYLKSKLYLLQQEEEPNSDNIEIFENLLFEQQKELYRLNDSLKQNFPEYYELKNVSFIKSLADVREPLESDEQVLTFSWGERSIICFSITADETKVFELDTEQTLRLIESSKLGLSQPMTDLDDLRNNLSKLYDALFSKVKDFKNRLIIVPDGALGIFPFELLVKENGNYMIQEHEISYRYAVNEEFSNVVSPSIPQSTDLIAFAPTFNGSDVDSQDTLQSDLQSLTWNTREVEHLKDQFASAEVFHAKAATENQFRIAYQGKNIIHLATHGIIDQENPMFSRVAFEKDRLDSLHDGFLFVHELYNMRINANLVVLSACETGLGKDIKGEGTVSLARGFAYAGVPSIVMSYWQVDDRSTSELMSGFYAYLAQGQTKSAALRQAKLDFLSKNSVVRQHPYYWGSFVVIGNVTPVLDPPSRFIYPFIFAFLLIGMFLSFRFRRKRSIT